ncbi:MAG: uracil-DNA glycosylase [Deltaproteobacteria bacterium]|nr:uracil-DNA glycosylase [Deltaproteobacteria bacterium]
MDGTQESRIAGPVDSKVGLEVLQKQVSGCGGCDLARGRTQTVFGEGAAGCGVMFIGEAPGAEEDATGRPFVGPAGQLLDRMIKAMNLTREECYIANVVKCRPPGNVTPNPTQTEACMPYLRRQIELIAPEIIVALGRVAANALTGRVEAIARLRHQWHTWGDIPFVVTYHPAALLRDQSRKKLAWEDLKMVMAKLRQLG